MRSRTACLGLLVMLVLSAPALALGQGRGGLAARMDALETAVAALTSQLADATATIAALQAQLDDVQNNSVLALHDKLSLQTIDGYPAAVFTGVNVRVTNGLGNTLSKNGTGNLIIGYNYPVFFYVWDFCSDGRYVDEATCQAAGETWGGNTRYESGSHNLIVGDGHSYSQAGGVVFGDSNVINSNYATVLGGLANIAGGEVLGGASVLGGNQNRATGLHATVCGGNGNTAAGTRASIGGGISNRADGANSHVSGGNTNTVDGLASTILGGGLVNLTTDNACYPACP